MFVRTCLRFKWALMYHKVRKFEIIDINTNLKVNLPVICKPLHALNLMTFDTLGLNEGPNIRTRLPAN